MGLVLEKIDYKKVFYYFEEISSIPRGSKNNKEISDYLVGFAKEHGLEYIQDEFLNVIIIKEASKGKEHCEAVVLQGHMDMVCEKESDVMHDFTKEGLDLKIEGDFIHAKGTTLGADDGVALAYALAILDGDYVHPRLEVIVTTDEETGMEGATGLDTSMLKAKYMLNLDSDEEEVLIVGCAGGMRSSFDLPVQYEEAQGIMLSVSVIGLYGGHSGTDINKNRTNATLLLSRLLFELQEECTYSIIRMYGGSKDNVIPREAYADLVINESDQDLILSKITRLKETYQNELRGSEPNLDILVNLQQESNYQVLLADSLKKVLLLLLNTPNGIQVMSSNIENFVESSLNLGIFHIEDNKAHYSYSVRSSSASYKRYINHKLQLFAESMGCTYSTYGDYPAWEYREESKLKDLLVELYQQEFKRKPKVEAIHAGLECGIIASKMPGIDIVSLGPNTHDIHTPQERLSISSAIRVFDYVIKILEKLCE